MSDCKYGTLFARCHSIEIISQELNFISTKNTVTIISHLRTHSHEDRVDKQLTRVFDLIFIADIIYICLP